MIYNMKTRNLSKYLLLSLGLLVVIIPMFYMITSSMKPNLEVFQYPPRLFPKQWTLENYVYVMNNTKFMRYLLNTIFVSLMTVLISTILASTLAYSFARLHIPGKKIIFGFVIAIMLIPGLAAVIPQFELAAQLGLTNSLWGVILFYAAWVTPFSTFLVKGYIEDNVPRELDEAIYMDGGSIFTVYRYVILPISAPAIAAIGILNFLFPFEELGWSQTMLKTDQLRTIPVALTMFFQAHNRTDWGYVFAMTVMAMIPVIVVYLLLQKYFISGLSSGAVKG